MKKLSKTVLTAAATLAIATGFSSNAEAASYTVKSGDSLWSIAKQHNTSIANLKSFNNLATNTIYVNQHLETSQSNTITAYKISPGDTLSYIAKRYNLSISNLKSWNNLSSDMIYAGQVLELTAPKAQQASAKRIDSTYVDRLIAEAKSHIGTPYEWAGTSPGGFDCSGFIYYAHKQAGKNISRTTAADYYDQATKIKSPQAGDLIFFKNTYKSGISHMGIYIGDGEFVHASSSGVQVTSVNNSYWSKYFAGYGKF
ncbi:C40 family peptidase [Aquibacillus saliphilus]|uniref:C40 family peptidase n=1 Tax=Aquibacillus saliphilus TaxID=1909422 RepID=UPI001CF03AAA|nr:LysM peptidoglycan-binding domain-containing protein [Aquibacillus saliphilus]